MNIVVCIKQVPENTDIRLNAETNTIIRHGIKSIINPFDVYAVEEAVRIREKLGGKVTVLSMGLPSVEAQLREAAAMGADELVLLSDRAFAGSDTLATSYVISKGIRRIGNPDLILCGKQTSDGDTAQVGPSVAEKLGIPHTTCVRKIEEINDKHIVCRRMTEWGHEIIEMPLPALITVVRELNEPRSPSLKGWFRAKNIGLSIWSAGDIDADVHLCGFKGSPTQVVDTFIRDYEANGEFIEGTPREQACKLVERLASKCFS